MFKRLFQSVEVKEASKDLERINELKDEIKALTDEQLKAKTQEFKDRLAKGETLEDIRIEAFAVAREATGRVLGKFPFDVQILGGLVLNMGSVAEMRTGEGKTITSIAPVYLNALSGKGVIVSTVNEYLTQRDAQEMGEVHKFMGLTVGVNLRELDSAGKRAAYACDITYSVHSELGFDYLRDNMVKRPGDKVQRGFNYALIDEVDSILIDEARTPLIISGGGTTPSQTYQIADAFAKTLNKDDFDLDMESKGIQLNEKGIDKANKFFRVENIFNIQHSEMVNRIQNALRANFVMFKDADYIVKDGKIEIVDSFTGRVLEGRSYSDGLHQAIQAKEVVKIEPETKTLATITYQNLFRMFTRLCGMSGTAKTEEDEFIEIYNMRVHEIPTNKPVIRVDHPDEIFVSAKAKYAALIAQIKKCYEKGQPILVGTEEVSESERVSEMLTKVGIPHTVLNAKQNQSEAEIIARAGVEKAITIATNMAGRGTDIKLTPESKKAGGLYVIGTNKAESRRIDNQLKGRSGRQGDVGESKFFLSLEDTLMSRFSNQDKLKKMFESSGDAPIKGKSIKKAFNRAQVKIEGFNFDSRKNVLQYDDVIRQQRDLVYSQRDLIIGQPDLLNVINRMQASVVREVIGDFSNFKRQDGSYDIDKMVKVLNGVWFQMTEYKIKNADFNGKIKDEIIEKLIIDLKEVYNQLREVMFENIGENSTHDVERELILQTFDANWQLHIDQMTKLRSSSSLASYAQQNPYQVYVEKGALLFQELLRRISHNAVRSIMTNRYAIKRKPVEEQVLKQHIASMMAKTAEQQNQPAQPQVQAEQKVPTQAENITQHEVKVDEAAKQIEIIEEEIAEQVDAKERSVEFDEAVKEELQELDKELKEEQEIIEVAQHAVAKQEEEHVEISEHKEELQVWDVAIEHNREEHKQEKLEQEKKESEAKENADDLQKD